MYHLSVTNDVMNKQIERFWKQEELPETPRYTKEEKYCELHFADTIKRDDDDRFIIRLPKQSDIILVDSKEQTFCSTILFD